jgi:hypothetical protein
LAEANTEFFDVDKRTYHFCRVQNNSVKNKVSHSVGDLINILYEKNKAYAADVPDLRLVKILER